MGSEKSIKTSPAHTNDYLDKMFKFKLVSESGADARPLHRDIYALSSNNPFVSMGSSKPCQHEQDRNGDC
jgi:hypothetical protein